MNTPKSMALGWGSLVLAAGIGFVFAKREINERRRNQAAQGTRPTEKMDWQARIGESSEKAPSSTPSTGAAPSTSLANDGKTSPTSPSSTNR